MNEIDPKAIAIRLQGEATDDGRTYVTSPDLRGFHFLLEPEDDPVETMKPALTTLLSLCVRAEIRDLRPAVTPGDYRARKSGVFGPARALSETLIAAVA